MAWYDVFARDTDPCFLCGGWWSVGWPEDELATYKAEWSPLRPLVCRVCVVRVAEGIAAAAKVLVECLMPALVEFTRAVLPLLERAQGLLEEHAAAGVVPVRQEALMQAQRDREPWRRGGRPR